MSRLFYNQPTTVLCSFPMPHLGSNNKKFGVDSVFKKAHPFTNFGLFLAEKKLVERAHTIEESGIPI